MRSRWKLVISFAALAVATLVWWLRPEDPQAVAVSTPSATREVSGTTTSVGATAWALAAEASRQANAAAPSGQRFCGAPFMDDDRIPEEERSRRLELHQQSHVHETARRLRLAPDEMGQLTGAVLENDYAAIAQLAHGTTDPLVYGLALRSCTRSQLPTCEHVTVQRWIQLDPNNAAAWWKLAATAKDSASAIQALKGAAEATHVLSLKNQLLKRVAASTDGTPEQLLPIAITTIGIDSADTFDAFTGLQKACGKTGPTDPALAAACQAYAVDAVTREPSGMAKWIAAAQAERMGMKPEQMPRTRTRAELKALVEAIDKWRTPELSSGNTDLPCDTARKLVAFDIASADEGDVVAFERRLKDPDTAGKP